MKSSFHLCFYKINKTGDNQGTLHLSKDYDKIKYSAWIPIWHSGISPREGKEVLFFSLEKTKHWCMQRWLTCDWETHSLTSLWSVICLQFSQNATRGLSSGFGNGPESSPPMLSVPTSHLFQGKALLYCVTQSVTIRLTHLLFYHASCTWQLGKEPCIRYTHLFSDTDSMYLPLFPHVTATCSKSDRSPFYDLL